MSILSLVNPRADLTQGYVYCWTNLLNGKQYIGSHNGKNPDYITNGTLILLAMAKYGLENFKRDILYVGPRYYEVETEMLVVINAAKTRNNWYNQTNNQKFEGQPVFSDEVTAQMSITRRQMFEDMAADGILHPFIDNAGEKNGFYGKSHTDEFKAKQQQNKIRDHHNKGNHPFPREHCSLCPDVTQDEMVALFKVAFMHELRVTPMILRDLRLAAQVWNYDHATAKRAITELQTEGTVKKVRGSGYVIVES